MKALKEKRVSLRSLFRRSLVILSVLALAFAAAGCSSSTDGGGELPTSGTEQPTNGTSGPSLPGMEWVSDMQVIDHPGKPSFEGARPELDGLKVMVTWKQNGKITRQKVLGPENFEVYPPVAYVQYAGTHVTEFSARGEYKIQYKPADDPYYDLNAYTANVYIPGVIALDPAHYNPDYPLYVAANAVKPETSGDLGDVYEDQGINAENVVFKAVYLEYTNNEHNTATLATGSAKTHYSNGVPPDTSRKNLATDYDWFEVKGSVVERRKENAVSSNTDAWRIERRPGTVVGTTTKPVYLASLGGPYPLSLEEIVNCPTEAGKFYYVDRFSYTGGKEAINGGHILADDPNLGGLASNNGTHLTARKAWAEALLLAGDKLTFEVTYYDPDTGERGKDPRPIDINSYYKAMYTPRGNYETSASETDHLRPRATLPRLTGAANATPARTDSGVTESVIYGYEDTVYVQLFYYHPYIKGYVGEGIIDDVDLAQGYETPNMALIPVSDLIWTYKEPYPRRIDSTAHPEDSEGAVEIVTNAGGTGTFIANGRTIYNQLQSYYDIEWVYENPNNPAETENVKYVPTAAGTPYYVNASTFYSGRGDNAPINKTWPKLENYVAGTTSQLYVDPTQSSLAVKEGDLLYDNSAAEEDEVRTCTLRILEPPSAGTPASVGSSTIIRGSDELEFLYVMKP